MILCHLLLFNSCLGGWWWWGRWAWASDGFLGWGKALGRFKSTCKDSNINDGRRGIVDKSSAYGAKQTYANTS